MTYEITERGLKVSRQVPLPVIYKDVRLDCGYRLDLLIDDLVIVEIKAVDGISEVHKAQLLSYLKIAKLNVGLLINFNVKLLKDGIVRLVNNLEESPHTPRSQRLDEKE